VAAIGGSGKRKACLLASGKVDASLPNLGSIFCRQLCNVMHKGAAFNDGVVPASSSISTRQGISPFQLREGAPGRVLATFCLGCQHIEAASLHLLIPN
jgi:hypothetical protein